MSILTHSPAIVRDGLVLCLDAGLNRSTNALADSGHPTGSGVEEDYQPTGCKLITRADKTIAENDDLRPYSGNTVADLSGGVSITRPSSGGTANGFYGYLNTGYGFTSSPVVGKRYRLLMRGKSHVGSTGVSFYNGDGGYVGLWTFTSTMKTYTYDFTSLSAGGQFVYGAGTYANNEVAHIERYEVYELSPWLDVSGNDSHAEMTNAPTFSTESGAGGTKSFDFDGSSDYISLDTSAYDAVKGGEITVGAWIKRDVDSGVYDGIVSTHVNTAEGFALLISGAHDTLFWQFDGTSGQINTSSAITIELNKWYYVVGTYSGGTLNTYVDGSPDEQGTASSATVLGGTDLPIFVGAQRSGLGVMGAPFNGKIAIVHMYNRALTAAEIQQNYRTHKGRFGR